MLLLDRTIPSVAKCAPKSRSLVLVNVSVGVMTTVAVASALLVDDCAKAGAVQAHSTSTARMNRDIRCLPFGMVERQTYDGTTARTLLCHGLLSVPPFGSIS